MGARPGDVRPRRRHHPSRPGRRGGRPSPIHRPPQLVGRPPCFPGPPLPFPLPFCFLAFPCAGGVVTTRGEACGAAVGRPARGRGTSTPRVAAWLPGGGVVDTTPAGGT